MNYYFDSCAQADRHATLTKSFGIFHSKSKNPNPDIHIHECCEVFLCLSGGKSFLIDDHIYDISDGDLFIINQFEPHKVVPDDTDEFDRYIMHVHPDFLYAVSQDGANLTDCFYHNDKITRFSLSPQKAAALVSLFQTLCQEHGYGDSLYKKLRATELLLECAGLFSTQNPSPVDHFSHRTVQLAVDCIHKNYAAPDLSLATVANSCFISPNQLERLFRRYCGTTVTKYLISKRISEAKKLLIENTSVTDTAYLCGFNDYSNFIRTFKKAVGIPPGKYRATAKKP